MSGAQSAIIASGGIGLMAVWLLVALRPWAPRPRHAAPRERLDATPDTLARWGYLPKAEVEGQPPWEVAADGALDWAARNELPPPVERTDGSGEPAGEWFEHTLHELAPGGLVGPPTRRLFDDLRDDAAGVPTAGHERTSRQDGAGDESEPSGVTAPPAPLDCCDDPYGTHAIEAWAAGGFQVTWDGQPAPTRRATATEVACARMDAFMAGMRADHAVWLATARERWAAA